jgi:membrane protease YdiL (CAAX protease family)
LTIAPIIEELAVRGLVMRSVRNAILRRGRTPPSEERRRLAIDLSIVVSALFFAAIHLHKATDLDSTIRIGVSALVVGLCLGWVATRTGRIGGTIIAHIALNGLGLLLNS